MNRRLLDLARKYHKWPALVISIFLIMFSLSGIVMNHRLLFSGTDISRRVLPRSYSLNNWNLAAVRGSLRTGENTFLIYGNYGIWKSDSGYGNFEDFNAGFPSGMDNRKVRTVVKAESGTLLAGTYFGLFCYSDERKLWEKVSTGSAGERIQEIIVKGPDIFVMTRSEIIRFSDGVIPGLKEIKMLPAPADYDDKTSLFRFLWITHSGEVAGLAGRLFLDLLAFVIIFLVSTGLLVFFLPGIARRMKEKIPSLPSVRRTNLRWHNKAGAWFFAFLLLVPFTGMFLRPPFLIPIADSRIPVIPVISREYKNAWDDKLRSMVWWEEEGRFIISASDGFYTCDSLLTEAPQPLPLQPPVSVMGINVFEPAGEGSFYVGSFDGLFIWNPLTGEVSKFQTSAPPTDRGRRGGPVREDLVSGMIKTGNRIALFDYDRGVIVQEGGFFPAMPENIISSSPMALWNFAQEIHTGRIYQPFLGPFYILVVPLTALMAILVFVTGYIRWRKIYRKAE